MRKQTKKMNGLLNEYKKLKKELFGKEKFIKLSVLQHNPNYKRYSQLFMFFYPQYRTREFINPLS